MWRAGAPILSNGQTVLEGRYSCGRSRGFGSAAGRDVPENKTRRDGSGINPEATVRTNHLFSTYANEADIVAEDTAVRYGTRSAAPRLPGQKKP